MDYRITTRVNEGTRKQLAARARSERKSESVVVREALEAHLSGAESVHARLTRIGGIGIAKGLPPDLSTNKSYLEGVGSNDLSSPARHRTARRTARR